MKENKKVEKKTIKIPSGVLDELKSLDLSKIEFNNSLRILNLFFQEDKANYSSLFYVQFAIDFLIKMTSKHFCQNSLKKIALSPYEKHFDKVLIQKDGIYKKGSKSMLARVNPLYLKGPLT